MTSWLFRQLILAPVNTAVYLGLPTCLLIHFTLAETNFSVSGLSNILAGGLTDMLPVILLSLLLPIGIFFGLPWTLLISTIIVMACMFHTVSWMTREIETGILPEIKQRVEDLFFFRLLAADTFVTLALLIKMFLNYQRRSQDDSKALKLKRP